MNSVEKFKTISILKICGFCCFSVFSFQFSNAQTKISVKGNLSAQLRYYKNSNEKLSSRQTWIFNINAQPTIKIGNWTVNTRFVLGNYQTAFRDFNRYGISPAYKWARFYLGHNTLMWSQFIMESRPVLGAGFDLTPGKIRIGAFAGIINKMALQDTFRNRIFSPTYLRQMIAIKLGYGTEDNFIDFIAMTASDKTSSLSAAQARGIAPASNGVFGIRIAKKITNQLQINADAGLSAYTQNQNERGNVIASPSPLKIPGILIKSNSSTQYLNAFSMELKYQKNQFNLFGKPSGSFAASVDYTRIEPNYQSMALYFLVNDIQRIKGGIQFRTPNQKLNINGNIGFENNDILNTQFVKNKRFINGISLIFRPAQNWTYSFAMQNFAVRLLVDGINANDSLIINQVNSNFNASASGMLGDKNDNPAYRPKLLASAGYQSGKNILSSTTTKNINHAFIQLLYYSYAKPGSWRMSPGYSLHRYTFFTFTTTRHIPTLAFDKTSINQKFSLHLETGFILTWFQKKFNTLGWRNNIGGMWNIDKKSYFQASVYYQPNIQKNNNFSELQGDLRYGLRF